MTTNPLVLPREPRPVREITQDERTALVEHALLRMEDGESLEAVARDVCINAGTLHGWIAGDENWGNRYENSKVLRARSFMERAIDEVTSNPDAKQAELKARTYMKLAAILNPKEFSDKMHTNIGKHGSGAGRVAFTLVFQGSEQDRGRVQVIEAQPEDGELP